ncbi:MAG TPA: EamA family transporter, partial [Dehalococcoidia bacterium]|nr:EamA family transporter [Dehalococcoidia bacterium]
MERNAAGALVAVGMLRGANFLFVGLLVQQIAVPELVAGRLGFAALAATAFLVARGSFSPMSFGSIRAATMLASLDTVVPYTLLAFAQTSIDSGVAAILATTAPLFTMLVAITLGGDERLSPLRLAGLFL